MKEKDVTSDYSTDATLLSNLPQSSCKKYDLTTEILPTLMQNIFSHLFVFLNKKQFRAVFVGKTKPDMLETAI